MENKKILLIRSVDTGEFGGAEVYQTKLGEVLRNNGFEPVIVTTSEGLLFDAKKKGFRVVRAPRVQRQNWSGVKNFLFPLYILEQKKLTKWYKQLFVKERPAVINVQSKDEWIAATRAAKGLGIRVLWTDHADFRSWVLVNVKVKYKNAIGKWILKCAKDAYKIMVISEAEKKWFEQNVCKMDNMMVVRNGVVDEFEKYKRVKANPKKFCFVGRLVKEKGIEELLDAFSSVKESEKKAELVLCGGEKDEVKVPGAEALGRVDDVLPILAECGMFVLPSYNEGMSLALLEAMMMGKTIITTDIKGVKELIKDKENGILVPAKDAGALEKAMIYVLNNPEKSAKMGEKARKKYEEEYDFSEIFAKRMLPLYNIEKEK